jgi:CO/xanthine dehydrogenase Mo-binding subunit
LPAGYFYVEPSDVPGDNNVNIVLDDCPVFARDTVQYIGEPIAMIVGPDPHEVEKLVAACKVTYEELQPELDVRTAQTVFFNYEYGKGDVEKAFAEADKVYDEEFTTGYQEQAYLEPQGLIAQPEADGRMYIHGSLQCPYYIHGAVKRVLGASRTVCTSNRIPPEVLRRQGRLSLHSGVPGGRCGSQGQRAGQVHLRQA